MANISDYLDWRGDLDFSVSPFCEVDNLILSELAYVDFDGIVPGEDKRETITIQKACRDFFSLYSEEEILARTSTTKMAPFLMKKLISGRRFGSLMLGNYVNEIDMDSQRQFSAVCCYLGDGTVYVAYRGTDNTIVGWKEDFNMGFLCHTSGQRRAVRYLNDNFKGGCGCLRVGGHSKGGNLAVYASSFCEPDVQRRIQKVYTNDGPGFLPEILRDPGYRRILPRVVSTIPESSIVGMLLENDVEHTVVKSSQTGVLQHDALSWEVIGKTFVRAKSLSESSQLLDRTLKNWLLGLDQEEREEFVDVLFGILWSTGATTLEDLMDLDIRDLAEVHNYIVSLPPETQRSVGNVLMRLAVCGGESVKEKLFMQIFGNRRKTEDK